MREVKFRVWDKILQCWNKNTVYFNHSKDGIISPEIGDRFELIEYTGLKDKNGKEIYEGDILSYSITNRIVMWSGDNAGFVSCRELRKDGRHGRYISFDRQEAEVREVIGNIYENPELLSQ